MKARFKVGQRCWDIVHKKEIIIEAVKLLGETYFYSAGRQTGARVEDLISESALRKCA